MTTKDDKAPVRADDDGPELAAIAEQVRPVVDAGKGRALAFEVVRAMLVTFKLHGDPAMGQWFTNALHALSAWFSRALDIESGKENERHPAERLTLLAIAGVADRIASQAWCLARTAQPFPFERAVVLDIATALRRACGCSDEGEEEVERLKRIDEEEKAPAVRVAADHTANTLLPLLIRDARRLCLAAKVDVGPIEAAVARHGGRPS